MTVTSALYTMCTFLILLPLFSLATASTPTRFQTSVLTYSNGTAYSMPQAIALAFSPTNPGLLLVADVLGTIRLLRVNQTTPATYVISAVEHTLSVGPNRNIVGLSADPFNPTIFFVSTQTIQWKLRGLGPAGWQNGKIQRLRLLRKQATLHLLDDLITGLPVSNRQVGNGLSGVAVDSTDGSLYVPVATGTGLGVNGSNSGGVPDSILSASMLKVDIRSPAKTRALKWSSDNPLVATLVDPPPVTGVQLLASGVRSNFQPVFTAHGRLIAVDGGANLSDEQYSETCTVSKPLLVPEPDRVLELRAGRYYGTPNRARGRTDPNQCVWIRPEDAVDPAKFPRYEAPLFTTAEAVERGDLLGGITGAAEYSHDWAPGLRGNIIGAAFDVANSGDLEEGQSTGIVALDLLSRTVRRVADGAGSNVAVDVTGTVFTALTTAGQIGVHTPIIPDEFKTKRRITGVWPPRGRPGSRLYIVGTSLPSYQKIYVGGVECTKVRRVRRYPIGDVVNCRVPRVGGMSGERVDVRIGTLTSQKAFTLL